LEARRGYSLDGKLIPGEVRFYNLKDWTVKYSDGKADPALVERWINIPVNVGMIHFYHPTLFARGGVSTFMCQGNESGPVTNCEAIHRTALDLGIVTSLDLVKSNDQTAIRATIPPRPKATGYATVTDTAKVPLAVTNGLTEYGRFLASGFPRAFAVAADKNHWAWNAGGVDAISLALSRCQERAGQPCRLYAVDDEVVWMPN
jgi:hypothetical protein